MHTLLFEEREGYSRVDVCETCWTTQHSQGSTHRKGFVSHWVSTYNPPPPPPAEPIQRETAESLLRKLIELNQPKYLGPSFILAVMLERRRILKARSQAIENGRRLLVYEHTKTGEAFTIIDPGLKLDQLDALQQEVARLLEHGLSEQNHEQADPGNTHTPSDPAASASGSDTSESPDSTNLEVVESAANASMSSQTHFLDAENERT